MDNMKPILFMTPQTLPWSCCFFQAATKLDKINLLKTSSVSYLPYPLKFKVEKKKQAEFPVV